MAVLLPTAVGGHLAELMALVERMPVERDQLWMTWRNEQTESLLQGRDVVWVEPVPPRDWRGVLRTAWTSSRVLRRRPISAVVTTGSGIALGVVPLAARHGIPCHFVESATHAAGQSVTGRILSRIPGVRLYTQHRDLADGRWRYRGSVFEGFRGVTVPARPGGASPRVVVTLGTMRDYPFRRLLERLVAILPPRADVLWQTGCTPTDGLPIRPEPMVPPDELATAMAEADVVVGHCGVGTALAAMSAGRFPVLVPRDATHGENVDDHQHVLARDLGPAGLAATPTVDQLTMDVLHAATRRRVRQVADPPPFGLEGGQRPTRAAFRPHGRHVRGTPAS
jgi:UDP-N-acetylglucosamine:LPS N-acetylglucosamine transferase